MKRITNTIVVSLTLVIFNLLLSSCGGNDKKNPDVPVFDVSGVELPATLEGERGGTATLKAPKGVILLSDIIQLNAHSSQDKFECAVVAVRDNSFDFRLHSGLVPGRYTVYVKRGTESAIVGVTQLKLSAGTDIDPRGANLYGKVTCEDKGVAGVVVSDGFEVVTTDADGVYRITGSKKELGIVFISLPSGYEPRTSGILPRIHQLIGEDKDAADRADFELVKAQNDKYTVIVMGDMHLANRNNDRTEFRKFTADVRNYLAAHPGEKVYGLTLGDMTWDQYWYGNSYYFPQYLSDMNSSVNGVDGLMTFHTIGNHDHDMNAAGDLLTEVKYVKDIAPTYYSFNLGDVHYVVLDNIECTNSGAGTADSRDYKVLVNNDQFTWLAKDLAYVEKTTPVVVSMHAPIYYDNNSSSSLSPYVGYSAMNNVLNAFKGYNVHFLTGHTHRVLNTEKTDHFDHNAGAVCATWWWSQKLSGINIGTDGAPGGYVLWDVDGTSFRWRYVGTEKQPEFQFRSYDLNNVAFDQTFVTQNLTKASDWAKNRFLQYYKDSYPQRTDNKVLINVWNYNPKWTVSVTEDGKPLAVTQVKRLDPLHILAVSAQRLNANVSSDPSFLTDRSTHFFEVQASSATSTLQITVTDEFGNSSTETMTRPKTFSIAAYK